MATLHFPKNEFRPIAEGTYIFRIYDVEYDVEFGKVAVFLVTANGKTHIERYNTILNSGETNNTACMALGFMARAALNDPNLSEIDHSKLINCYVKGDIKHTVLPNRNDPTKTVTFVNVTNVKHVDRFDTEPCERALTLSPETRFKAKNEPAEKQPDTSAVNLSALLD